MAEFDDFNFDMSSDEGEFEGFTHEDIIKTIEKGAQIRQLNDGNFLIIVLTRMMDFY